MIRSQRRWARAGALALVMAGTAVHGQEYPSRPISLVVGFAPGGSADILARLIGQKLAGPLGQQVVIENKPGAGGTIAGSLVAAAKPDGYTLLFVTSGHAGSAALYPKLSYDPVKGFAPVVKIGSSPVVILSNAKSPLRTFKEVIANARANPGKLNYGAGGGGATVTRLAAEFLKRDAKLDMVAINYKGSAPALTALLSGEIDLGFDIPSSALPHINAGTLRALAVTSKARSPLMPTVPTVAQEGVPRFEVTGWFGVLAPAGTPGAIVSRLNREIGAILRQPDVKDRLVALGVEPSGGSAQDFGRLIEAETKRTGEAIQRLGIKVE